MRDEGRLVRIVHLVDVAEVLLREWGAEEAVAVARRRSDSHFDPKIVSVFERWAPEILAGLPDGDPGRLGSTNPSTQRSVSVLTSWTTSSLPSATSWTCADPSGTATRPESRAWRLRRQRLGLAPEDVRMMTRAGWCTTLAALVSRRRSRNRQGPFVVSRPGTDAPLSVSDPAHSGPDRGDVGGGRAGGTAP